MDVGFIGLGKMGIAMARNPHDAFQTDVAFTMLSDDAAIGEVLLLSNVLDDARAGVVHVVTSTISVDFVDELRAKHAEARVGYVAARPC